MDILMMKTDMKKRQIVLDQHGRWADCPNEPICMHNCNPSCPQYPAKVGSSLVGSLEAVQKLSPDMEPEEVLRLWKAGKLFMCTDGIRKCAVCGKTITSGYVWDGTDTFCSDACAAKVFDGDHGCVNILIDDGRLVWKDKFN